VRNLRVLVTAAGSPGAPAILKSLMRNSERSIKIFGVDMNPNAVGFAMVDGSCVVPPGRAKEFVPEMLKIVKNEGIDVILPLATYELQSLAESIDLFEHLGTKVMVSDADRLAIVNNKGEITRQLSEFGLPAPSSFMVETISDFIEAVRALGYPRRPVCFKPQLGKGSIGFRVLNEDVDKFDLLFNHKPENVITTLEEILPILETRRSIPKLIVSEYLPGKEYSVDVLCKKGQCYFIIPRSRDQIKLGISFTGTVVKEDQLIEQSETIVQKMNLSYNINLQFKYDDEGTPKLIEINPRMSGTIFLCVAAGVNLPYLGVKLALNEDIPRLEPKWGTKLSRYWDGVFYDKDGHTFTL